MAKLYRVLSIQPKFQKVRKGNFLTKFPEIPQIVEFPKSEQFNQKLRKFWEELSQIELKFPIRHWKFPDLQTSIFYWMAETHRIFLTCTVVCLLLIFFLKVGKSITCTRSYVLESTAIIILTSRTRAAMINTAYKVWARWSDGVSTPALKTSSSVTPSSVQLKCFMISHQLRRGRRHISRER